MFGDERRLADELLLLNGPEVLVHQVLWRSAGLQVVFPRQAPQPQQLAVTVQRVSPEAHRQPGRVGHSGIGQHLRLLEQCVRRQRLQTVRGHVQPHQLGEEREGPGADVVDQIVVKR